MRYGDAVVTYGRVDIESIDLPSLLTATAILFAAGACGLKPAFFDLFQGDVLPVAESVILGRDARISHPELVNLYGCRIGDGTSIGPFVEIQAGAVVGARCKVQSHSFICDGVTIEDEVFIGHGVMFVNDRLPRATDGGGQVAGPGDWTLDTTVIRRGASIGSGAVILPVTVGQGAIVGAGAVVTHDVLDWTVVAGNPARVVRSIEPPTRAKIPAGSQTSGGSNQSRE